MKKNCLSHVPIYRFTAKDFDAISKIFFHRLLPKCSFECIIHDSYTKLSVWQFFLFTTQLFFFMSSHLKMNLFDGTYFSIHRVLIKEHECHCYLWRRTVELEKEKMSPSSLVYMNSIQNTIVFILYFIKLKIKRWEEFYSK